MQIKPLDHNPDLNKLIQEGLSLEIKPDCVLIRNVPYLDKNKDIKLGTLVSSVSRNGNTLIPADHTCSLFEEVPCDENGIELSSLCPGGRVHQMNYSIGRAQCYMSIKPSKTGIYRDFYQKFKKYISLVSRYVPYYENYLNTNANVNRTIAIDSVFTRNNTNDIESGIQDITYKLKGKKVAIIGVGGTGSFVFDYICKTEVHEIHIFDSDRMEQKNLFRIPGYTSEEIAPLGILKVDYIYNKYSSFRKGIYPHSFKMDKDRVHLLVNMDFVFVCIDKTVVKKEIFEFLVSQGIPFVDVGMGITRIGENSVLRGQLRTTIATTGKHSHLDNLYSEVEVKEDDEYSKNIQIVELNSLNASLAVIKMKKHFGIYQNDKIYETSIFKLGSEKLINENKS